MRGHLIVTQHTLNIFIINDRGRASLAVDPLAIEVASRIPQELPVPCQLAVVEVPEMDRAREKRTSGSPKKW